VRAGTDVADRPKAGSRRLARRGPLGGQPTRAALGAAPQSAFARRRAGPARGLSAARKPVGALADGQVDRPGSARQLAADIPGHVLHKSTV
jgi:hypothetical protein